MDASILIFGSTDDLDEGWLRALRLKLELEAQHIPTRVIDKLSSNLDDLLSVAQRRILRTPTVLLLHQETEKARWRRLPTSEEIVDTLKLCSTGS